MSKTGCIISHEGIEYLCGLIRDINGLDTNLIDDLNIKSNGTFSSVRINTLLTALKTDCNDYTFSLVSNLSRLELKIVTDESSIVDSNILYLHKPTGQNSYNQYVVIEGNKVLLGTTDINMTDYYTITQADTKFTLKTDFDALKTEVDKVKNDKVDKSGDTMTGTLTIKKSGDDATLLTFDTERSWSFKQGNTGASASLDLVSSGNDKKFRILNTDKTKGLEVHASALATSVRIDGNKVITEDQLQG